MRRARPGANKRHASTNKHCSAARRTSAQAQCLSEGQPQPNLRALQKKGEANLSSSPPPSGLTVEINADVKPIMVPLGLVIAAPLACCVHSGNVMFDLTAMFAVAGNIAVNSGPIRFQATVAFVFEIIRTSGIAICYGQSAGQRTSNYHSGPERSVFHWSPP